MVYHLLIRSLILLYAMPKSSKFKHKFVKEILEGGGSPFIVIARPILYNQNIR